MKLSKNIITEKEIKEARSILQKYKAGKTSLEKRIVEDEMFWKRRHWEVLRKPEENGQAHSPVVLLTKKEPLWRLFFCGMMNEE